MSCGWMVASPRGEAGGRWRRIARALIYRVPEERDTCPACASVRLNDLDLRPLRTARQGRYVGFVALCEDCGLVFSNPLPSADDLKHFYSPGGEWRAAAAGATVPAAIEAVPAE